MNEDKEYEEYCKKCLEINLRPVPYEIWRMDKYETDVWW